jgi:hypothetical protein
MIIVTGLLLIDQLRVDQDDACVGHEHADIAAAEGVVVTRRGTGQDVVVVRDLHAVDDLGALLRSHGHRHPACQYDRAERQPSLHLPPP